MLIGVDGGNTKTVALVARPDGTVTGRGLSGCSDIHNAPSVEVALDAVAAACQDALFEAGISASDITAACFNMAGADWPEDFQLLGRSIPELVGLPGEPLVVNDAIAPIRAGTVDGAGVSVVCGTFGTTAGRNRDGRTFHVGFWPDRTGARGLGQDGLAAVWRSQLQLGPETSLTGRALELYGSATPIELLHSFTRRGGWPEPHKERLAPVVLDEAIAGDPVAAAIIENHGRILGQQARSCADAVGLLDAGRFPVVLTGGVFHHHPSTVLQEAILAHVPEGDPVSVPHAPVIGALLLAFDQAGLEPDVERIAEGAHA
jgi:N-acetylglucosamine kinase-like BadF-type ATPase